MKPYTETYLMVDITHSENNVIIIPPERSRRIPLPVSIFLSKFTRTDIDVTHYDPKYIENIDELNKDPYKLSYLSYFYRGTSVWLRFNRYVTLPPDCTVDIQFDDRRLTGIRYYETDVGAIRVDAIIMHRLVPPMQIRSINKQSQTLHDFVNITNLNTLKPKLTDLIIDREKGTIQYKENIIVPSASVATLSFRSYL